MYKAVFIDIDGTLLKDDHTVSDANKSAIKRLLKKNIPVILVSARPLDGIIPISETIGTLDYPVVSLNGGYIVSGKEVIYRSVIDLEATSGLTKEIQRVTDTIVYYLEREWFAEINNGWIEHEQKIMNVKIKIQPFEELISYWKNKNAGPNKILVMSERDQIRATQNSLKSLHPQLNIYTSKPTYLEIMNTDASKSNAIKILLNRLNIDRTEIIAIGDNFNDKEMIEFAGTGVAMGNAPQEIKEAADYITDTNNNDGVQKALDELIN